MSMIFRTRIEHLTAVDLPSPHGSEVVDEYGLKVNAEGLKELEVVGQTNIYKKIQEAAFGTSVYEVIEAYARSGDISVLEKQKGVYADVTGTPRTLAELEQFRIDSRNAFYSLPVDVRRMFGDNYYVFMSDPEKAQAVLDACDPDVKKARRMAEAQKSQQAATGGTAESDSASGSGVEGVVISTGGNK